MNKENQYKRLLEQALDTWERQHPFKPNEIFGYHEEPFWVDAARRLLGRKSRMERIADDAKEKYGKDFLRFQKRVDENRRKPFEKMVHKTIKDYDGDKQDFSRLGKGNDD